MDRYLNNKELVTFPRTTIMGSMAFYITHSPTTGFQPMNANFGIMEPLDFPHKKDERKMLYGKRALEEINKIKEWLNESN